MLKTEQSIENANLKSETEKNNDSWIVNAKRVAKEISWGDFLRHIAQCSGKVTADITVNVMNKLVTKFGRCSTQVLIRDTYGIARDSALKAWYGGGSIASGGKGIAGGELVLTIIYASIEIIVPIGINACGAIYDMKHK